MDHLPQFPPFTSETVIPGLWIAAVAVTHVFLAQFAVGGGALVLLFEWRAERRGDEALREFLQRFFTTLVLVSFVLGAVTGVGIWLTLALVAPRGLLLLVTEFHWVWAAEWAFFCLEVIAGYAYYRHRRTLPFRSRMILVSFYSVSAWMSLFWVNGILSFQLTPGSWPDGTLWSAFFNPAFWPTLIGRTVAALATAGIVACVVAQGVRRIDDHDREEIVRATGPFFLPLVVMPVLAWWFLSVVPPASRAFATGESFAMTLAFGLAAIFSLLFAGYVAIGLFRRRPLMNLPTGVLLLLLAACATGATEFVREGIRKPYLVYGHFYANGVSVDETRRMQRDGVPAFSRWPLANAESFPDDEVRRGRRVYETLCGSCHTAAGRVNSLLVHTAHWDDAMLRTNLASLHLLKPFMPPFGGNDDDLQGLIAYLKWLRDANGDGD